jgi:hypothetical protein
MTNRNHNHQQFGVAQFAKHTVISDPITPSSFLVANESVAVPARIGTPGNLLFHEANYQSPCF